MQSGLHINSTNTRASDFRAQGATAKEKALQLKPRGNNQLSIVKLQKQVEKPTADPQHWLAQKLICMSAVLSPRLVTTGLGMQQQRRKLLQQKPRGWRRTCRPVPASFRSRSRKPPQSATVPRDAVRGVQHPC